MQEHWPIVTGPLLEAPEKLDHRRIHFLRPLLLGPVTTAREHERSLEVRDELRQVGNELVHTAESDHQVPVPGHVERGNGYARPSKRCEKFPVAVDIAVPVQTPTKPGTREFPCEELDVGLGKPRWQGRRVHAAAEETT